MAKRSSGVGSGVGPLASTAHTTEARHIPTGQDIALGMSFTLAVGDRRQIVVQTHAVRDSSPAELNAIADKVCDMLDRINGKYRLKELALLRKQKQAQMAQVMENNAAAVARWEQAYEKNRGGRRGPFQLSEQQHQQVKAQTDMLERIKSELIDIETEVAETKQLIG